MARRRRGRTPEIQNSLNYYKSEAMKKEGYTHSGDDVKYEVASKLGIPMSKEYNGQMTAENAGKIGGRIGGAMVKEMIRSAQQSIRPKR